MKNSIDDVIVDVPVYEENGRVFAEFPSASELLKSIKDPSAEDCKRAEAIGGKKVYY